MSDEQMLGWVLLGAVAVVLALFLVVVPAGQRRQAQFCAGLLAHAPTAQDSFRAYLDRPSCLPNTTPFTIK